MTTPKAGHLKRADREIAQPQVGEAALVPDPEQRPIEREPHRLVAFLHGDADTLAEVAAVEIGAAPEGAAVLGIGAVEPERERNAVAEQEIDIAALEREPRHVRARIGARLDLGEQGL